jgi:hypothetical protein
VLHLLCLMLMWLHPITIKWKPRNMTWWCNCEIMQGICFERNVMNMYGSWDIKKSSYICLQVDLVLLESFQSMILVILTSYAPHHSNKITLGNIFRSLAVVLMQSPNMNIMVVFLFIECWDCGNFCFSCSFYVHGVWFHCKICNLWSVACCHMYCCCGCTSAWFCEANVRTSYCWWDIIFFLWIFFSFLHKELVDLFSTMYML